MYPIAYSARYEGTDRNRLTTCFRLVLLIPLAVVFFLYTMVMYVMTAIAWFAMVVTGQYHAGFYPFNAGYINFAARLNGYASLLTDQYPPFSVRSDLDYPIRVGVPPAKAEYSRLKAFFRIVLLIPVVVISYLMGAILTVCSILAWFAIVFSGELPEALYRPIRAASAWHVKALSYAMLITEEFPPIWVEEEEEAPRFGEVGAALPADPYAARTAPDPYATPGWDDPTPPAAG